MNKKNFWVNFWVYLLAIITIIDIVCIFIGIKALKIEKYEYPSFVIVLLSIACWVIFGLFAPYPIQEKIEGGIDETDERYAKLNRLTNILTVLTVFIIGAVFLTSIAMSLTIGLKVFVTSYAHIFNP